jgi:hypothetical protein
MISPIDYESRQARLHTLIYYVVAFAAVIYIEKSGNFRSGPCTPNLDIFAPLMFFIMSVIVMIVDVTKAIRQLYHGGRYPRACNSRTHYLGCGYGGHGQALGDNFYFIGWTN